MRVFIRSFVAFGRLSSRLHRLNIFRGTQQRRRPHDKPLSWTRQPSGRCRAGRGRRHDSLSAALAADPIKIGVISEAQAVAGSSIAPAAQLAAEEINAKGGVDGRKIEIVVYDDHSSSAEAVRAFQRAVSEDKVNAVIASYVSEVVLALEPWAGAAQDAHDHARRGLGRDHAEHRQGLRPQQIHLPWLPDLERAGRPGLRRGQGPAGRSAQDEDRRHHERGRRLDDAAGRRLRDLPAEGRA